MKEGSALIFVVATAEQPKQQNLPFVRPFVKENVQLNVFRLLHVLATVATVCVSANAMASNSLTTDWSVEMVTSATDSVREAALLCPLVITKSVLVTVMELATGRLLTTTVTDSAQVLVMETV